MPQNTKYILSALCVVWCALALAESSRHIAGRRMQAAAPDERVSILDGTLPSPELGPRSPPPPIAKDVLPSTATATIDVGHRCGSGCIAGSVFGSIAGFAVLVFAVFFCWRCCQRRKHSCKGERSLSQIDLLANGESYVKRDPEVSKFTFCAGNPVFCQMGKCCASGAVIDNEGEEYRVRLTDGGEQKVRPVNLAMNYAEGATVLYTPPEGGNSIKGTVLASNGNFWPPFYQIKPQNPEDGTINTTAQCLAPAKIEDQIAEVHATGA